MTESEWLTQEKRAEIIGNYWEQVRDGVMRPTIDISALNIGPATYEGAVEYIRENTVVEESFEKMLAHVKKKKLTDDELLAYIDTNMLLTNDEIMQIINAHWERLNNQQKLQQNAASRIDSKNTSKILDAAGIILGVASFGLLLTSGCSKVPHPNEMVEPEEIPKVTPPVRPQIPTSPTPRPEAAPERDGETGNEPIHMILTTKMHVRVAPHETADRLTTESLFVGSRVTLVQPIERVTDETGRSWIKIHFNGREGWISDADSMGNKNLVPIPEAVTVQVFMYNWEEGHWEPGYWGDKSKDDKIEFMQKVAGIAKALNIDADHLMAVLSWESWFSPSIKNRAGSGAVGLIQFMPSMAEVFDTTSEDLVQMSAIEQLDYVYSFFLYQISIWGEMHDLGDVYMQILCPRAVGKPDDYVLWERGSAGYRQNSGLDLNGDGKITKAEALQKVINRANEYRLR
jgi:hypothetical protein